MIYIDPVTRGLIVFGFTFDLVARVKCELSVIVTIRHSWPVLMVVNNMK